MVSVTLPSPTLSFTVHVDRPIAIPTAHRCPKTHRCPKSSTSWRTVWNWVTERNGILETCMAANSPQ